MKSSNLSCIFIGALATAFLDFPCRANVPTPPPAPPVPAGYCSTIDNELQSYLNAFNQTLGNPAPYPTLQVAQLQMADSNAGPAISGPNYLASVMVQAQTLKAMGFKALKVEVAFPVLYAPFFGGQAAMQPYLTFYQQLAQSIKGMGLKLVVENNVLLSTGTEVGWPNVAAYYQTLSWTNFLAARATMAGTVAQYMQPDYLVLSEEPDNEAVNAFQPNLNNPVYAAAMISGEIIAARAASLTSKLGAGFGTWMGPYSPNGLLDFITSYMTLPLDYLDMHIYPINTEYNGQSNFLQNALTIASSAAAALKPVAISESWAWKMENAEFNVVVPDTFRARSTFGFWAPLDTYFIQTMETLANYTRMLYLTTEGANYLLAYQTYGGTTANGGAANCTCTTMSCSNGDINAQENTLADNAGKTPSFTTTGVAYNSLLVSPPDKTPPTAPSKLSGTAGYNSATLSWTAGTDQVGVAGYNIYRCSPAPCTGVWVANSAATNYYDYSLSDGTKYQYTVQAFDMANNLSPMSNTITLTTALNTPPGPPNSLMATAVSSSEIDLSWSPPVGNPPLGRYEVYRGSSCSALALLVTLTGTTTTYRNRNLHSSTTYCYGVKAYEQSLVSPMSNTSSATTLK